MLSSQQWVIAGCVVLNIASSISIVMLNKWLYTHHHFPNMTLTCLHFLFTSAGLKVCNLLNMYNTRYVPLRSMLPLCASFCGFVVLTNLSLQHNTVGTYQLIKVLTTPCIMLIHSLIYKKTYSTSIVLTLIPITIGVFLNSYYDVKFNVIGVLFATAGVVVTSFYQVWVGTTQADLNLNSMQLLSYQAPLSAGLLMILIPFFEPVFAEGGIFNQWPLQVWLLTGLSGCVAFSINLTIFWIIGNLSPVTYNMIGHLKFCFTLTAGFLLFHDAVMETQLLGVVCTFAGVLMYTHLKVKEQRKNNTQSRQTESRKPKIDSDEGY